MTPESHLILEAGSNVQSIRTGEFNVILQRYAEEHAALMAEMMLQDHHNWSRRFQELTELLPEYSGFKEICAESWPNQSAQESAVEMFDSWRQSSGHWAIAHGRCDIYGYSMCRGDNGVYYGCGIVGLKAVNSKKGDL